MKNLPGKRIRQILIVILVCCTSCSSSPQIQFDTHIQTAKKYINNHNYMEALQELHQADNLLPDSAEIHERIGSIHLKLANLKIAEEYLQRAVSLQPNDIHLSIKLAKLQINLSNLKDAQESWENLKKYPHLPEVHIFRGDLLILENQLQKAEKSYRQALKIDQDNNKASSRLAVCLLAKKNLEDAETIITSLVSQNPTSPEVLFTIGSYYKLKNDYESAADFIAKASAYDPENLTYQKVHAEFNFSIKQFDAAKSIVSEVLKKYPNHNFFNKLYIEILLSQHDLEEVAKIFEKKSENAIFDIEFLLLKGKYHLLNEEPDSAVSLFSEAITKEPKLAMSHYLLAVAYMYGNHANLAKQSAIQALSLDINFSEAELLLADIYYKNKAYDIALKHALRICAKQPENFRGHMVAGNIFLALKKYDDAIGQYAIALQLSPGTESPLYYSGVALELSGNIDSAFEIYQALSESNTTSPASTIRYVNLMKNRLGNDAVIDYLEKILATRENDSNARLILGDLYLETGNQSASEKQYLKAIEISPNLEIAYWRLSRIYTLQKKWLKFVTILQDGLNNNPRFTNASLLLADYYRKNGAITEAITILENALIAEPEAPLLLNSLAWIYLENDMERDKAFILAQSAYDKMHKNSAIADTLGWAYYKKNNFTRAEWLISEALDNDPKNPLLFFHLGKIFLTKKNTALATHHFNKALTLGLKSPSREEALKLTAPANNFEL